MLLQRICVSLLGILAGMLLSCGGSSGSSTASTGSNSTVSPPTDPIPTNAITLPTVAAISANPTPISPELKLSLLGEPVIYLNVGDEYFDMGATAIDTSGNDISSLIERSGSVNTESVGDYVLKYEASDGNISGSTLRIIRVFEGSPAVQTHRLSSSVNSNLSYLEHLPEDYGAETNRNAPLIIFNHGSGATGTGRLSSVECCGLPNVIELSTWDDSLPFVVLSPQRISGSDYDALNDFVDFALDNYQVDPNRVYMTGWSQGAQISVFYAITYPEKVAAVAPTAGGTFFGVPETICDAAEIPMWTFLGARDADIINNAGAGVTNALNNCPTGDRKRLTIFSDADHFNASIWPYLPQENRRLDTDNDQITESIFEWFLSHSN